MSHIDKCNSIYWNILQTLYKSRDDSRSSHLIRELFEIDDETYVLMGEILILIVKLKISLIMNKEVDLT